MYICFIDELLLFCKNDIDFIRLTQHVFHRFPVGFGLHAKKKKPRKGPSIHVAGVKPHLKKTIFATLGYVEGEISFKYVGVPISSKRLSIA